VGIIRGLATNGGGQGREVSQNERDGVIAVNFDRRGWGELLFLGWELKRGILPKKSRMRRITQGGPRKREKKKRS